MLFIKIKNLKELL